MIYENWIGKKVSKISGKPFKSKLKVNTVKALIEVTIQDKIFPAFLFEEDESFVTCRTCQLEE